ncbi:MAG: C10 family peptidase [Bacteroidales bacterium]|jgi:hypothetical protein|nr:C10 family peptidase [Bacteroidales bacterium]
MSLLSKLLSGVFLILIFTLNLFADRVEMKTAMKLATNFYYERALMSGLDLKAPVEVTHIYTQYDSEEEIYYVFNTPQGFIIVAADDDVYPVLAYSFDGKYNLNHICPAFSTWMKDYEEQITFIRSSKIEADNEIGTLWRKYTVEFQPGTIKGGLKSMEPLLISTWDQGTYYNHLCPEDPAGPDGFVWAGCVATAMAQVMYYYRYPLQGSGSNGYYSDYGYLSANFGTTSYKWNNMQNDINGKYNYDMALLQYHCGIAVEMGYSPDGSGAYMWDAASAMKTYFGYSSSTDLFHKDDGYSSTAWANLLIDDLDNKMPIQYSARTEESGHAFVCDGYQGNNYFHFNWGWGGAYNGYFYLNNLNPGYNFNFDHKAILNSYPAGSYPQYCSGNTIITNLYGTIEDGSSPRNNYHNNADCQWLIAPSDTIEYIMLKFERINTEAGHDVVIIYDGESTTDPILGTFSGNTIPGEIQSTGNKVLVRFISDGANNAEGWLLSFTSKNVRFCNNLTELTEPSGIITDGSGPHNYNNSTMCRWRIMPPDAASININFNSFNLAADFDLLRIYDENTGATLITYQGQTTPQNITAYSNKILILFLTGPRDNADGWEITYSSAPAAVEEYQNAYVSIFPNPAHNYLKIEASVPEKKSLLLEIFGNTANILYASEVIADNGILNKEIDISRFSKGIYFLKLTSDNFNHIQKFVIY